MLGCPIFHRGAADFSCAVSQIAILLLQFAIELDSDG
jgi:hypothetical protein